MMKLTKRILAFVLVLCTVAAWMIPGVSAEEVSNDVSVNFVTDRTSLAIGEYQYWTETNPFITTTMPAYNAGTIKWHIYRNDTTWVRANTQFYGGFGVRFIGRDYTAIEFKAPATGAYDLTLTQIGQQYSLGTLHVYLIPSPATAFANTTELAAALPENPAITITASTTGNQVVQHPAGDAFELTGGQSYLLVIGTPADVAGAICIRDFKLAYQIPVATTDFTVTYHANDGSEATKVDTVNETAATKDFTVQENSFTRDGYVFKGWATSDNDEALYKAGDTITLTSDAPTKDLYAVWEEAWDPANNTDLTVDFTDTTGLTSATWFFSGGATTNSNTVEAGYPDTYMWKPYRNAEGTLLYGTNAKSAIYSGSGIQMALTADGYAYLPLEFKPTGTGDYKLTVTFCYGASEYEVGAYIIDVTNERFASTSAMPKQDSGSAQAVVTLDSVPDGSTKASNTSTTTVSLDANGEYAIVFFGKGTGSGYVRVCGFKLEQYLPVAEVGGEKYYSLDEAIDTADKDATITMLGNASLSVLDLSEKNLTLDLNGFDVDAGKNNIICNVIDSKDGTGFLFCGYKSIINTGNQLALWGAKTNTSGTLANGYTIYKVELKSYEVKVDANEDGRTARTFYTSAKFTNENAYSIIASNGHAVSISFDLQWENAEGEKSAVKVFDFDAETIAGWAGKQAEDTTKTIGCYVRVFGFEALGESGTLTATPKLTDWSGNDNGFNNTITGKTMEATYEHIAAEQ